MNSCLSGVLHDIRGGALHALLGLIELQQIRGDSKCYAENCVKAARNHANMIRDALIDIDSDTVKYDQIPHLYKITDFTDKWKGTIMTKGGREVAVSTSTEFHGKITPRCLETTLIDRILCNLVNNAARWASDGRVDIVIVSLSTSLVRLAVINKISADHEQWLHSKTNNDYRRLFSGGITRNGSGIGLNNCVTFVATTFGLGNSCEAIDGDYIGLKLIDHHFYSWFHWPVNIEKVELQAE